MQEVFIFNHPMSSSTFIDVTFSDLGYLTGLEQLRYCKLFKIFFSIVEKPEGINQNYISLNEKKKIPGRESGLNNITPENN